MATTPFFSNKDEELITGDTIRDHMGVLPVWSAVARELVPHLANSISNINGIIAVLFIYSFDKHYFKESDENTFRRYFRLMEGLIEYYFAYGADSNSKPCYGTRLLNSSHKEDVRIHPDDKRTFANGLHQYYRGTCRRAKVISNDWEIEERIDQILFTTYFQSKQNPVISLLNSEITKALQKDALKEINPGELFSNELIPDLFTSLFNSADVRKYIRSALYGDNKKKYYAYACSAVVEQHDDKSKVTILEELSTFIHNDNSDWHCFHKLENQLNCEPFLSTIVDCFSMIQIYSGDNIPSVSDFLADSHKELSRKAKLFLKLKPDFSGGRFDDLYVVAEHAANNDIPTFLTSLIDYQCSVMARRDKEPMVIIEGGIIQKLTDYIVSDKEDILDNIKRHNPMRNNYFIWTTARIYNQLFDVAIREQ